MTWRQTLTICGSIFLAVGISRDGAETIGILILTVVALWPVVINTQQEIRRRNAKELENNQGVRDRQ